MAKNDIVLGTDENGEDITISQVQNWLDKNDKGQLSKFAFKRLYGRYLKPFEYDVQEYKENYKHGFSIMANCCLLIETFISFSHSGFTNTHGKSERCFGIFFNYATEFKCFSKNGLTYNDYLDTNISMSKQNMGLPKDFYSNVRCGILHSGETKNGWIIRRNGLLFDYNSKTINATKFALGMKKTIKEFERKLLTEDFDTSQLWQAYLAKLNDIIQNA